MFDDYTNVYYEIDNAIQNGADVINFSWITGWYDPTLAIHIHNALLQGVVCIASAGNNEWIIPSTRYPACYNFGSDGQVIAVSGTQMINGLEQFIPGFNYSQGTDPINDPTNAFIDCSAPGTNYRALDPTQITGTLHIWAGTSISAPFVSALVALIYSINNSLTPQQIYTIITNSTDKIGSNPYNANGWNQYMGYGRINAYNALKYTLEHYGGTISQSFSIPQGETWNFDQGITLNFQTGVTLTVDGTLITNSNLTIPAGVSLTANPGAVLKFASGTSLNVYGTLNASGNYSQHITFTSTSGNWGSIVFNGSGASNSSLNFVDMQNGTNVQVLNTSDITIDNFRCIDNGAIIFNNSTGSVVNSELSASSAGGNRILVQNGSTVNCYNNKIHDYDEVDNTGIVYSDGSYGNIGQNDIDVLDIGINIFNSSSPRFHNPSYGKNNRITNCSVGIKINTNSYPVIGYNGTDCFGANSIHDNFSQDIMLNNSGGSAYNLNALGTYWNNGNPVYAHFYIGQGSQIDASLYLSTDPWAGIPLPSMARGNTGTPQGPGIVDSTIADPLSDGIQFRFEGKFNEAKDFFISYLGKNPNDQRAYVELYNCYNNKIANEITSYFEKLPSFASNEQKLLLGYLYLKQGKIKSAKDVNNQIISQNSNTPLASRGKLNNFYITLYNENDMKGAASILSDVISKKDLLTPTEISIAQNALKTYVPANTLKGEISPKGSEEKVIQTTPSAYKLEQNYPNPFNPTTTISYQLSADSHVTLKVFDVLGREVAVLVNGQKNAGSYKATFDGTKFASGVYIYQLKANDYLENKKMILTK